MNKRLICLVVALMLVSCTASAAVLTGVTGSPTNTKDVAMSAKWAGEDDSAYKADSCLQFARADQTTLDMIADAFNYIYEEQNPALSWYPEEAQQKILEIAPADLCLTEFTLLSVAEVEAEDDLDVRVGFGTRYAPGQMKAAVLGVPGGTEDVEWTVLKITDAEQGTGEFTIPKDYINSVGGKSLLFTMLTASGEGAWDEVEWLSEEREAGDSVTAEKEIYLVKTVKHHDDSEMPNNFNLEIVEESESIKNELSKLQSYTAENPALTWLPEEDCEEACLLANENAENLVVKEYVALSAIDYHPCAGDAVGSIHFPAKYEENDKIIAVLGLPKAESAEEGTDFDWVAVPAIANENGEVDIVFNQWALEKMNSEAALLLLFGQATK